MSRSPFRALALGGIAAAALVAAPVAQAHVTLQPSEASAGSFTVLDIRVPNESEDTATTKVDVQVPEGFESARYQPVPGWDAEVTVEGDRVTQITWTGDGESGKIDPGEFVDFPISVRIPEAEGPLTFPALQTYEDGEVVRWIGEPDSDKPAPVVTVTAAEGDGHGGGASHGDDDAKPGGDEVAAEEVANTEPAAAVASDGGGDDDGDGLAIAALIVGGLGLLAGGAALITGRKRTMEA